MPYKKHNRYITDEQFSDGTTIDGSRIDTALGDVQGLVNSIPRGDLDNRYTQTQYVMGWSPAKLNVANQFDTSLPWVQAMNDDAQLATLTGGTPNPPDPYQNPQRAKGYATLGISPVAQESALGLINGAQYIWTTPIHFGSSVIVKSLEVFFMLDSIVGPLNPYGNGYVFTAPPPGAPDNLSRDVTVGLIVDRPKAYGSEDRRLNQIAAVRSNFVIDSAIINHTVAAPTSDMFPTSYPGGDLKGKYFELEVNEPLPEDSRVRVCVAIPSYVSLPAVTSSWDPHPWLGQYYSVVLTVLEELEG